MTGDTNTTPLYSVLGSVDVLVKDSHVYQVWSPRRIQLRPLLGRELWTRVLPLVVLVAVKAVLLPGAVEDTRHVFPFISAPCSCLFQSLLSPWLSHPLPPGPCPPGPLRPWSLVLMRATPGLFELRLGRLCTPL